MKIINFKKEKNEVINKRTARIIGKCKKASYFLKKIRINKLKIRNIVKLRIIVIIQGNIEVLHIINCKL